MASFTITAVPGGTGSGTHTISVYNVSPNPVHGTPSTRTIDGRTFYTVQNVRYTAAPYSGTSQGYDSDEIPAGWYYLSEDHVGANEVQIYVRADSGGTGFGGLKVAQTNIGSQTSVGSNEKMYGLGKVDDLYFMWYTTATAWEQNRVYPLGFGFKFDGIDDYVNPDTPPYHGDTGHGGGAGDSGGTGGMGSGIDDGDQVSTHKDLDETAKQALLGYGLNAYVIDSGNLLELHKWLWGYDNDYMDALWKKWQNYKFNPMAGIVACHRLPNELKPATATAVNVKLAGITLQTSGGLTGVSAAPFSSLANRVWSSEYTVNINAPKGDFTDFANVQMGVFLPFCGTMALDPTQVMGRPGSPGEVRVQYCCNALTGDCTAFVRGTDQFGNTTMLGVANGNCAETHPLCGNDNGMSQKVSGLMSVVGGLAGSILTQNPAPAVGGAISGVSQVAAAQNHTQIIGQPGGANGWASLWTCYVYAYWNVPLDVNDDGEETGYYNSEYGRPSFVSASVSDFSGFTMLSIHADGIATASDEEKREIERLCAEGIII